MEIKGKCVMRRLLAILVIAATMTYAAHGVVVSIPQHIVIPDRLFVERQCAGVAELETAAGPSQKRTAQAQAALESLHRLCARRPATPVEADAWTISFNEQLGIARSLPGIKADVGPVWPASPLPASYRTYTVLLIPSAEWLGKDQAADLADLLEAYKYFGDAIVESEAAITFLVPRTRRYDVIRSKDYCDKWRLNYNDGPYVITTNRRPDLVTATDEKIVIKLGGISQKRVTQVLNVLELDLRRQRAPRSTALLYEEIKQAFFSFFDRNQDVTAGVSLVR